MKTRESPKKLAFLKRYNEIKAQNPDIMDKDIAILMGISKDALSERKRRYGLAKKVIIIYNNLL